MSIRNYTYRLQGIFERRPASREAGPVSLQELVSASTQLALGHWEPSVARLHRAYGWDFLRIRHIRSHLAQSGWRTGPVAPVIAPRGAKLNSLFPGFFDVEHQTYAYQFRPLEPELPLITLDAADARLPTTWQTGFSEDGWLELASADLPTDSANALESQVVSLLVRAGRGNWLGMLETWQPGLEALCLPLSPHVEALLPWTDAVVPAWVQMVVAVLAPCEPTEFQRRLTLARGTVGWDERLESWLLQTGSEKRRAQIGERFVASAMVPEPDFLALRNSSLPAWFLEREFAGPLRRLISQAQRFLFVGSFVIEDIEAAGWLAQKAEHMPGRVWVMCDLKEAFQDHLDALLAGRLDPTDRRFELHRKKWESLRILLRSPAQVRWVNGHLKAYMSEREALFGSANLAPRSLRGNLESYLRFEDAESLRALYQTMATLWHYHSEAKVYRPGTGTGLVLESIATGDRNEAFLRSPVGKGPFMDHTVYATRVIQDLRQARKSVHALLYSVSGDSILLKRGKRSLERIIGVDSRRVPEGETRVYSVNACHAKIVVIDRRIVYMGGVNDPVPAGDMMDLMVRLESEKMGRDLAFAVKEVVRLG